MEETKLQRLLNACDRFVYGNIPRMTHVTPYRLALGWLFPLHRRNLLLAALAFMIVATDELRNLSNRLIMASETSLRTYSHVSPGFLLYPG